MCLRMICIWVVVHIWMSHVTHVNESLRTGVRGWCVFDSSRMLCMSHGTSMHESCHTYEWIMSHSCSWMICTQVMVHIWMSHATHVNESSHIGVRGWFALDSSLIFWMSNGTNMHEPCHTYETVMAHSRSWMMCTRFVTFFLNVWRHEHAWFMARMQMSHGTYLFVMICPRFFVDECWHKYARAMAHICMSRDAQLLLDDLLLSNGTLINEPCHICKWVMSHRCSWIIYRRLMARTCMIHVTHVKGSCHTGVGGWFALDLSRISRFVKYFLAHMCMIHVTHMTLDLSSILWMSDGTNMHESCYTCEWVMTRRCSWMICPRITSNIEWVT